MSRRFAADESEHAVAEVTAAAPRRILIVGATDTGKSSFIARLSAAERRSVDIADLDPGQKMIGPPGTVSLGRIDEAGVARCSRFIFIGTTSASDFTGIAGGAAEFITASRADCIIGNTAGFVQGPGYCLQAMTIAAYRPDLLVFIGTEANPIMAAAKSIPAISLQPSLLATRKTISQRAENRQRAFSQALEGAERISFLRHALRFEPAPPLPFADTGSRPVCVLTAAGQDYSFGIMEDVYGDRVSIFARPPERRPEALKLGKMWAHPTEHGWRLEERLSPSWREQPPADPSAGDGQG